MNTTATPMPNKTAPWRPVLTWGIPAGVLAAFAVLAASPDLRLNVSRLVAVSGVVTALLAVALYAGERGLVSWPPWVVIAVAAVIRVPFILRPPELSDDIYRYLWDGLRLLAGANPYAVAPAGAPAPPGAFEGLAALVNHPHLVTVYPPAAQIVFAAGAATGLGLYGIKALLAVLDLGTCALLLRLLPATALPPWRAILYAWHPLAVVEIAGSGHIDAAGIFFFLLALSLALKGTKGSGRRFFASGAAFSASVLVKLFPAVYAPGLFFLGPWRSRGFLLLGAGIAAMGLVLPFWPGITHGLSTLSTYVQNWEFANFAFQTLRSALGSGPAARMILGAVFALGAALLYARLGWRSRSPLSRKAETPETFYAVSLLFLFLTPTLHPWYGLYLAVFLPWGAGAAGLVFSFSVLLAYQVLLPYTLEGRWIDDPATAFWIWAGPFSAGFLAALVRRWRRRPPARNGGEGMSPQSTTGS